MKNLVKNSESVLLTIVTLCAMYFIGSFLVGLFQHITMIGQDEITGLFATLPIIANVANIKMKDLKDLKDVKSNPFTLGEAMTKTGKNAHLLTFEDREKAEMFRTLSQVAGIASFPWYSQVQKGSGLTAIGVIKSEIADRFITSYYKQTFKTALELKAEGKKQRDAEREAKKAQGKKTVKANSTPSNAAKIAAYKDLFDSKVITLDQYLEMIAKA